MDNWQTDLLDFAMQGNDENLLFQRIINTAQFLGYEYVAYGSRYLHPVTAPRLFLINNYPSAWQNLYKSQNYIHIDPYVARGLRSSKPVIWDNELISEAPEFWEQASEHGLSYGWGQSVINKTTQGLVTFSRSSEPITALELRVKQAELCWLAQISHLGMCHAQRLDAEINHDCQIALSSREREILRWTADGKTCSDISLILGITQRTVNFHIHHCIRKMNCQNKIAAAVKASLMGLLWN